MFYFYGLLEELPSAAAAQPVFVQNSTNDNFNVRQAVNRVATVVLLASQPFVPFNTPQVNTIKGMGWYQPLGVAAPVAKAQPGITSVPLNTKQTNTVGLGWHRQKIYYTAPTAKAQQGFVSVPLGPTAAAAVAPPNGWFGPPSNAAKTATAQPSQATSFAVPASVTPTPSQFGWYQPLSWASPVAKAQQGFTSVPFNTAQFVPAVPTGWAGRTNTAAKTASASPSQATSFAVPPSVATGPPTPGQFGWYQPLSQAVPVAKVSVGYSFVPFNTAQFVPSVPSMPLYMDGSAPRSRNVYYQSLFNPIQPPAAAASNTITGIGWFQPLGVAALTPSAGTRTQQSVGSTFVPLNMVQPSNSITSFGWYAPLSLPARVATITVATTGQGSTFVPFNTVQVAPPPATDIHFKPFFATPGQLMNT